MRRKQFYTLSAFWKTGMERRLTRGLGHPGFVVLLLLVGACASRGPGADEPCSQYSVDERGFEFKPQLANVEVEWFEEWTSRYGEALPEPLPPQENWQHPILSNRYAGTMHEDSFASDVSHFPGPIPSNTKVGYFHVLEKGKRLSGMAPLFTFLDDDTVVTISFGRDAATLLVIDISGPPPRIIDSVDIPGRGYKMRQVAGSKGRRAVFRDTSGGAYSYLDATGHVYVPGANDTIIRIPIRDRRVVKDEMVYLNLNVAVQEGTIVEEILDKKPKENKLTAIMPDAEGRVWFTSKFGVVGVIDTLGEKTEEGCPKIYAAAIQLFAVEQKARQLFAPLPEGAEEFFADAKKAAEEQDIEKFPEIRARFRELFLGKSDFAEQIQNSFSVGPDGVYIVSNIALYKLRFNADTKKIELDPSWKPTYAKGDLVYDNDHKIKPGHLNDGSGTTPTVVGDRFVAIVDNGPESVHLNVFRQDDGALVSKLPLFDPGKGAVENSVVAYRDHLIVGNTYGYFDPFKENETAGGIMRFDFDAAKGTYVEREGWPAAGHIDGKTATPKLSTPRGLIYVYNREDELTNGHHDWVLTAIDFRTGWRVFKIKGYFDKGEFDDSVSRIVERAALGKGNYDRKVFNNIWGTFTFGPDNTVYLGAYRGFLRFWSDDEMP